MQQFKTSISIASMLLALGGCAHTTKNENLPTGAAAYNLIPAESGVDQAYLLRSLDTVSINVFGEPQLSTTKTMVSEDGTIEVPLVGTIDAKGRKVSDVAAEIERRLGAKYLVDPQVSVSIQEIAIRYASVEGEVKKPGVYEISKDATLLSTVARAESPTSTARLSEIVVFRTVGTQHLVARFNLKDIRTGIAPDPSIRDGDVIMVGYSTGRGLLEDVLKAAPLLNIWAVFSRNN